MSLSGNVRVGLQVTGLNETIRGADGMIRELGQFKMNVLRDASTFFVLKAKDKIHNVSGDLGRSTSVDSITPQGAIVSAKTKYAKTEEDRPGRRRTSPGTPHTYMAPSAVETGQQMPRFIKKRFEELLSRHKTRAF